MLLSNRKSTRCIRLIILELMVKLSFDSVAFCVSWFCCVVFSYTSEWRVDMSNVLGTNRQNTKYYSTNILVHGYVFTLSAFNEYYRYPLVA